jgi:hypothetical protein
MDRESNISPMETNFKAILCQVSLTVTVFIDGRKALPTKDSLSRVFAVAKL